MAPRLLFIEVKGRVVGAETVSLTRNEILTGFNKSDRFILALAEVADGTTTALRYLRCPFVGTRETFFDVTSVNYSWPKFAKASPPV